MTQQTATNKGKHTILQFGEEILSLHNFSTSPFSKNVCVSIRWCVGGMLLCRGTPVTTVLVAETSRA